MARNFNGTSDHLAWANVAQLDDIPVSIAGWVKLDTLTNTGYVLHNTANGDTSYGTVLWTTGGLPNGEGAFQISVQNSANGNLHYLRSAELILTAGVWHHIAGTWDGTDQNGLRLYLDGVELTGGDLQAPIALVRTATMDGSWSIGGRVYDNLRNFDGAIAEVAVWDRELTAQEVASLGQGYTPDSIKRSLLFYTDLIGARSSEINILGGEATHTGSTKADHPPMRKAFGAGYVAVTAPAVPGTVSVPSISSAEAFGALTVAGGSVVLSPAGISSGEAFGSASVTAVPQYQPHFERENNDAVNSTITVINGQPLVHFETRRQVNELSSNNGADDNWAFFHLGLNHALGTRPLFRFNVTNGGDQWYRHIPMGDSFAPWYSEDNGATWLQFDTVVDGGGDTIDFQNSTAFTGNDVLISFTRAFTPSDMDAFFASLEGLQDVHYLNQLQDTTIFGYSPAETDDAGNAVPALPMHGLLITDKTSKPSDGNKRVIVLLTGQHAYEDIGDRAFVSAVTFLVSSDPAAQRVRQNCAVYIFGSLNPGGRYGGHWRGAWDPTYPEADPNRCWTNNRFPSVTTFKTFFESETQNVAHMMLDYHSWNTGALTAYISDDGDPEYNLFETELLKYFPSADYSAYVTGDDSNQERSKGYFKYTCGAKFAYEVEISPTGWGTDRSRPTPTDQVTWAEATIKAIDSLITVGNFTNASLTALLVPVDSSIASEEAFGTATITVSAGLQDLAPTAIASAEAFGTPLVAINTASASAIVKTIRVTADTGGGFQQITIPGIGTPKAALIYASAGTVDGTGVSDYTTCIGATDGNFMWAMTVADGTYRDAAQDAVIKRVSAGIVTGKAHFEQWVTDGIELEWEVAPAGAFYITVVFFVGPDVQAAIGTVPANSEVSGLAFQPNLVFFTGIGSSFPGNDSANAIMSYGIAADTVTGVEQYCVAGDVATNAGAGGSYGQIVRDNAVAAQVFSNNEDYYATLGAFTSDGFDLVVQGGSTSDALGYLAIRLNNMSLWLGDVSTPTVTGNRKTSIGFEPGVILGVATYLTSYNTVSGGADQTSLALSVVERDGDENTILLTSADGVVDTESVTAAAALDLNDPTGAAAVDASFVSTDSTGFTLNYTNVDASSRTAFALAISYEGELVTTEGIPSEESFGTPVVVAGAVEVLPTAIPTAEAFGTPSLSQGYTITVTGIASEESFGAVTVDDGSLDVVVSSIVSAEAFGAPTLIKSIIPDVKIESVTVAANGASTQDITLPGYGTPKAVMLVATSAHTDGVENASYMLSIGFADGTLQRAMYVGDDTVRTLSSSGVLQILENNVVIAAASFDSFITDGVRLTWGTAAPQGYKITATFISGDDVDVSVGQVQADTAVTGLSFQPDAFIALGTGNGAPSTDTSNAIFSIGMAARNGAITEQYYITGHIRDGAGARGLIVSDRGVNSQVFADAEQWYTTAAFTSDGWTNTPTGNSGADDYVYLALGFNGVSAHVKGFDTPTVVGVDSIESGSRPGFSMLISTFLDSVDTVVAGADQASFSLSLLNYEHKRAYSITSADGSVDTGAVTDTVPLLVPQPDRTSAITADTVTYGQHSLDVNYTGVDGTARKGFGLFIESTPKVIAPSSIPSGQSFGAVSLFGGDLLVIPAGVVSEESFGTPGVFVGGIAEGPNVVLARTTSNAQPTWTASSGVNGGGNIRYKWDDPDLSTGATVTTVGAGPFTAPLLTYGWHVLYIQEQNPVGSWGIKVAYQTYYWELPTGIVHPHALAGTPQDLQSWSTLVFNVTVPAANQILETADNGTHVLRQDVGAVNNVLHWVVFKVKGIGRTEIAAGFNTSTQLAIFDLTGAGAVSSAGGAISDEFCTRLHETDEWYHCGFRTTIAAGQDLDIRCTDGVTPITDNYVGDPAKGYYIEDIQLIEAVDYEPTPESNTLTVSNTPRHTLLNGALGGSLGPGTAPGDYYNVEAAVRDAMHRDLSWNKTLKLWMIMFTTDPSAEVYSDYYTNAQALDLINKNSITDVLITCGGIHPDNRTGTDGDAAFANSTTAVDAHALQIAQEIDDLVGQGVGVRYVEPLNEPFDGSGANTATNAEIVRLVKELRTQLDVLGHSGVGIMVPGHHADSTLDSLMAAIQADPTADAAVARWSHHNYDSGMRVASAPAYSTKLGWQTEGGSAIQDPDANPYPLGGVDFAAQAARIMNSLYYYNEVYMQFLTYANTEAEDIKRAHRAVAWNSTNDTYELLPNYYVFEQMSAHFDGAQVYEMAWAAGPPASGDWQGTHDKPRMFGLFARRADGKFVCAFINTTSSLVESDDPQTGVSPHVDSHLFRPRLETITLDVSSIPNIPADAAVTVTRLGGELTGVGDPLKDYTSTQSASNLATSTLTVDVNPTELVLLEIDGIAEILPGGIESAEAFGTPVVSAGSVIIAAPSIGTGEAFGAPTVLAGSIIVSPVGTSTQESFGTATVTAGAVGIAPTGIATGESFGGPGISAGAVDISPTGIPSEESFGNTAAQILLTIIAPQGIPSGENVNSAVVNLGGSPVLLVPGGIASDESFGAAQISVGGVNVSVPSIGTEESFGIPAVATGAVEIAPTAIASQEVFGSPVVSSGATIVTPASIGSAESFGASTVAPGGVNISVDAIPSGEAFGSAIVTAGGSLVSVDAIASLETFGSPEVTTGAVEVIAPGIGTEESFGTPAVGVQGVNIVVSGIASAEAFGTAILTGGSVTVAPNGIASAESFGGTEVIQLLQIVEPQAIPSAESVGDLIIYTFGTMLPAAIASEESFGTANVELAAYYIRPQGIATEESFGSVILNLVNPPIQPVIPRAGYYPRYVPPGRNTLYDKHTLTVVTNLGVSLSGLAQEYTYGTPYAIKGNLQAGVVVEPNNPGNPGPRDAILYTQDLRPKAGDRIKDEQGRYWLVEGTEIHKDNVQYNPHHQEMRLIAETTPMSEF